MTVRTNADIAEDADRARRFGAQGIGLCRTEHMFLGDRRALVEALILAETDEERDRQLAELLPLQRKDFVGIFEAMDDLPVTIRLLDPPLHEFLPDLTELSVRVALAEARGDATENDRRLLQAVHKLHEQNPMLGLRGVRLGVVIPGLFEMQARAILEAAAERILVGGAPRVEIMVPLVATVQEFETVKQDILQVARDVRTETGVNLEFLIGTMIELPRAARDGRPDCRIRRVLLLRHQRSHPDDLGFLPRRRGGVVLLGLSGEGHLRRLAVRDDRS